MSEYEPSYFGLQYSMRRDLRPFDSETVRELPKGMSGVYAIWVLGEAVYVGMSEACVRSRLLGHLNNSDRGRNPCLYDKIGRRGLFKGGAAEFSVALARSAARELEAALIQEWRPECNSRGVSRQG